MSVEYPTRCPHCRAIHEAATGISGREFPEDGDCTLCIRCGKLAIFDSREKFGLRVPNRREQHDLDNDSDVQKLLASYAITRQRFAK